jgi:hypothetical protein
MVAQRRDANKAPARKKLVQLFTIAHPATPESNNRTALDAARNPARQAACSAARYASLW